MLLNILYNDHYLSELIASYMNHAIINIGNSLRIVIFSSDEDLVEKSIGLLYAVGYIDVISMLLKVELNTASN